MVVHISLPRMLRLALRVIGVANCLLLFWLCVGMQRQRVEEKEIQALRLIESDAIKRISILTSKVTTVLTVLQAVYSTQSGRHHARPLTAPFRKILDNEPMLSGLTVVDEQGGPGVPHCCGRDSTPLPPVTVTARPRQPGIEPCPTEAIAGQPGMNVQTATHAHLAAIYRAAAAAARLNGGKTHAFFQRHHRG
ncbi:hypothetical protein J2S30_001667 [Herbaspirillum rubrisubalbicans]|uniref:hypothetical protein n=1 Tax=Herbaspirillum rubrisubalbicans TaxID=80842 RepID=UPI00209F269B|nr:hypothetical protein [Herbaspirillum rubrisubalbicans]MCP1573288.1 hypothetical protein [Herbaspirillum rubrisubalbicans]